MLLYFTASNITVVFWNHTYRLDVVVVFLPAPSPGEAISS